VRLLGARGRSFLVGEQPLVVVEVHDRARGLLERAREGVELPAPSAPELRFLRRLRELGLVELRPAATDPPPTVSVIVPVRDRPEPLAACLRSLRRLRFPAARLELIVVDDGSAVPATAGPGVRVLRAERPRGPAAARNLGAEAAGGGLLAFLDSDCTAAPGWLEELVGELADPEVAAAGGRVAAEREWSWLERYEAVRSSLDLGRRYAQVRPRHPVSYLVTANLLVRREDFARLGGFDERLTCGEDVDLVWRLVEAGRRVVYQPRALVRHRYRPELGHFLATRVRYAASEGPLLERHPRNRRFVGFSPGMAALLAGGLAALLGAPRALLAPGVAALAVEVAGGARTLARQGLPGGFAFEATLRAQGWSLYYPARQLARYALLPAAVCCLGVPGRRRRLLAALGVTLAAPSLVDWYRLRPRLSPVEYLGAQLLDDLAYHTGVLAACLRGRTLVPLAVEVRLARRERPRAPARRPSVR
jgi:mycofactocin system glycosyltransferase